MKLSEIMDRIENMLQPIGGSILSKSNYNYNRNLDIEDSFDYRFNVKKYSSNTRLVDIDLEQRCLIFSENQSFRHANTAKSFRQADTIVSFTVCIDSIFTVDESIALLMLRLGFPKIFIQSSLYQIQLFDNISDAIDHAITINDADSLQRLLSTDWTSLIPEFNKSSCVQIQLNPLDVPKYEKHTFDDLVSRKIKEWSNLSIEHDSSECTMILFRWMHEHNAFCNEEKLRL